MTEEREKIRGIKIRYGITRKVKGRYVDLALYHIKYVHTIEYPESFKVRFPGKMEQAKSNNIKIFKRLKTIYKLKFDPKSQWLTKIGYIHTVKSSFQCCQKFQYIGLNLIRDMKRLKEFEYNFPYRLSFDQNKIKDINYLKFTKDLKRLSVHIDSFDNKEMYRKLFKVLEKKKKLEATKFTKINMSLTKPYFDTLKKLQNVSIMNGIQIEHLINLKALFDSMATIAVFTAPKCLLLLGNWDLFKNIKHLELNDLIVSSDFDDGKHFQLLNNIYRLGELENLLMEVSFTQKNQTGLFFQNLKIPPSVKRLELTLLNIFFSSKQGLESFYNSLANLESLKLALTISENFASINQFIEGLPQTGLKSLKTVDFLFRTENEFDETVHLDSFLLWAGSVENLKEITMRTTNFVLKQQDFSSVTLNFSSLEYLRLSEEFGRKNSFQNQERSKQIIDCLGFLEKRKSLLQLDLVLNLSDLFQSFSETIFSLLESLPMSLKALRFKIIHKKEEKLDLEPESFAFEIQNRIQALESLKVLELNMPIYFRFNLQNINKYQKVLIPGIWYEKSSNTIYYW